MTLTYGIVTAVVTYILGAINKAFIPKIDNKYIPFQNVLIGLISGFICYFSGVETNLGLAIIECLGVCILTGGSADLIKSSASVILQFIKGGK